MNTFYKILLPTLVLTTISLSACKQEPIDDPKGTSTVDEGVWTLDERMDTTVRPGDDFDMYCNGTWWKSAGTGDNGVSSFFETDLLEVGQQYTVDVMASPIVLGLGKLSQTAMDNTAPCAARMAQAVDMVNGASDVEELWHVTGKLMKAGYKTPFHLLCLANHGIMTPTFMASDGTEFLGSELEAQKALEAKEEPKTEEAE